MNRRHFLQQSSLLATGLATLPACSTMRSTTEVAYPMGYQLFSVRDVMKDDPLGTLKALKQMEYAHFEIYGYDAERNDIYGYKPDEFRRVLADLDLLATSGHFGFNAHLTTPLADLDRYTDRCIAGARAAGLDYLVWPFLAPDQRDLESFRRLAPRLNRIGERVTAAGLGFAFHNNGYEWQDLGNGQVGYDIILAETDPALVKLQLDMYWCMKEGRTTPKEVIANNSGRVHLWHIKDMHKVSRDYTELGNGSLDYTTLMPDPATSGLKHFYIEQGGNFTLDSMTSAKVSAEYFKTTLREFV